YAATEPAYAEQPAEGDEATAEYGQTSPDGPYYGDNGQLLTDENYAAEAEHYVEEKPRRRSGLVIGVALVGLVGLGAAGAYGYRTLFTPHVSGPPPIIKADNGPNKVVPTPANDGSGNKQITDRIIGNGTAGEKIVPREEQPVDVRPVNTRPNSQLPTGWPAPAGTPAAGSPSAGSATGAPPEPKKVQTTRITLDEFQRPQTAQPAVRPSSAPGPAPSQAATPA